MLSGLHTIWMVASIALLLLNDSAAAMELQIGGRVPAMRNEKIIVKNDGGVRNATNTFAFGDTCYLDRREITWFIVRRIVGDQVLVEIESVPVPFGLACPNGAETSRPLIEMRARLNAYARTVDAQLFEGIRRPVLPVQK
jgi:hypothetical protein